MTDRQAYLLSKAAQWKDVHAFQAMGAEFGIQKEKLDELWDSHLAKFLREEIT